MQFDRLRGRSPSDPRLDSSRDTDAFHPIDSVAVFRPAVDFFLRLVRRVLGRSTTDSPNPPLRGPGGRTALPVRLDHAHHLCFLIHDVMLELLRSGELVGAFTHQFPLSEAESRSLNQAVDIFEWIDEVGRQPERAPILRAVIFPALLSDFLHFIYEALQAARKGKLAVAYALLRKPLQDDLRFVLDRGRRPPLRSCR